MKTLEDLTTPFGHIKICESPDDGSRTYIQDEYSHSRADKNGTSLVAYIHAMQATLLQAGASRILTLGCAGGTLATMLTRAGCDVTMIDINPHAFDLARRYFALPPEVECVLADARHYLETTREQFDGIAIDVFDNGEIPLHLRTVDFFQLVYSRLAKNGVIVINAIMSHDLDLLPDNVAASVREATGLPVTILDEPDESDRNIIITAGYVSPVNLPVGNESASLQKELKKLSPRAIRWQASAYYNETLIKAEAH